MNSIVRVSYIESQSNYFTACAYIIEEPSAICKAVLRKQWIHYWLTNKGMHAYNGNMMESSSSDDGALDWLNTFDFGDLTIGNADLPDETIELFDDFNAEIGDYIPEDEHMQVAQNVEMSFEQSDIMAVFNKNANSKERPYVKREVHVPHRINHGVRRLNMVQTNGERFTFPCRIYGLGRTVMIDDGTQTAEIGVVANPGFHGEIILDCPDFTDKADLYAEEVNGKGSGLGFSSFFHLCTCIAFASRPGGIIEPESGNDVEYTDIPLTIEVTGLNYKNRETPANWCINKYLFTTAFEMDFKTKWLLELSRKEECGDTSAFIGSSIDQDRSRAEGQEPDSPYAPFITRLHECIQRITIDQIEGLTAYSTRFFHEFEVQELEDTEPDYFEEVEEQYYNGCKANVFGHRMVNSYFKALPLPQPMDLDERNRRKNFKVKGLLEQWDDFSTYHTVDSELYNAGVYRLESAYSPPHHNQNTTFESRAINHLMKYMIFQAVMVDNTLLPRIRGQFGYYFSDTLQIGIAWQRPSADSLGWHCCYYCFDDPGDIQLVGKWSRMEHYFRSPNFIVGRQDVLYATALHSRFINVWTNAVNVSTGSEWRNIEPKLMTVLAMWYDSTWRTTYFTSCSRFMTTGHLSGNDIRPLIIKSIEVHMPLRRPETLYFNLLFEYLNNRPNRTVTPLLHLPLKYHCLEKDIGLGMNWHMRISMHETTCCLKMINAIGTKWQVRDEITNWYMRQADFMETMEYQGVTYRDFKILMDTAPSAPAICVPFMIACTNLSKQDIQDIAGRQQSTGFCINEMVSDRGSALQGGEYYESSKVADELIKMVNELDAKGPYDLLFKILEGEEFIEHVYLMSSKNQKSGDREIATQYIKMRACQFFSESMQSIVSEGLPDDALMSSEKYCPMVSEFTRFFNMNNDVVFTSEDRSFHCGNNHPESMSLVSSIVCRIAGVLPMASSAAMQRCWTTRSVVLPAGFDTHSDRIEAQMARDAIDSLPNGYEIVSRRRGGKLFDVPKITMEYHMMQGIQAIAAGVINTIYNRGTLEMARICTNEVEDYYIITTSDDVGRAVAFKHGADTQELTKEVVRKPLHLLQLSSQINNWKKYVETERDGLVEVNNVTTTYTGMVSQTLIHSTLTNQPLKGESIIQDIMNVVSDSRSSIFWGDSPVLTSTSYNMGLREVCNKWILPLDVITHLKMIRLIPHNLNTLVEGMYPRSKRAWDLVVGAAKDPVLFIDDVIQGKLPLFSALLSRFSKNPDRLDEEIETPQTNFDVLQRKINSVYSARRLHGKLRARWLQFDSLDSCLRKRDEFINYITNFNDTLIYDTEDIEACTKPAQIRTQIRRMRRSDKLPRHMGLVVGRPGPKKKAILCYRKLGMLYRGPLRPDELEIAESNELAYNNKMVELDHKSQFEGMKVTSPAGLPIVRFLEKKIYLGPHCFNFVVNIDPSPIQDRPFMWKGELVRNFRPLVWGKRSLKSDGTIKAFGVGTIGDHRMVFFKRFRGKVRAEIIDEYSRVTKYQVVDRRGKRNVSFINADDYTPLDYIPHYGLRLISDVVGDEVAKLNYGGFYRSSDREGSIKFNEIFQTMFQSDYPWFARKLLPNYPSFHPEAIEFNAGTLVIKGSRHIAMVKRVAGTNVKYVNADTRPPQEYQLEEDSYDSWD